MDCLTQKIELNTIIPAIRKEFISILEKKDLNDSEIARKLKITKSAISQYKHRKRGKKLNFPKKIEDKMGRDRTAPKFGPRNIDLDIVVWNGEIVDDDYYTRDFLQKSVREIS